MDSQSECIKILPKTSISCLFLGYRFRFSYAIIHLSFRFSLTEILFKSCNSLECPIFHYFLQDHLVLVSHIKPYIQWNLLAHRHRNSSDVPDIFMKLSKKFRKYNIPDIELSSKTCHKFLAVDGLFPWFSFEVTVSVSICW